ncbi:AUGMIN subunit 8 isoform X1 [Canna indica]|uniref:AUGMIN subunit 8 isoform X1 n=1 Tax=Canna indica TaxID=4628 RepID=A0AAQ3JVS1_9LILI|nr:AUGMIN subunit 8 isoform X1 [Canna indica]
MPTVSKLRAREIDSRYNAGNSSAPISNPNTPKRCSFPTVCRTYSSLPTLQAKRAQSAERNRPITPSIKVSTPTIPTLRPSTPSSPSRSTTPIHDTVIEKHSSARRSQSSKIPDGSWPSLRSLSSSFQYEAVSVPAIKKEKVASSDKKLKPLENGSPERKRTPSRGRSASEQPENSLPMDNLNARVKDRHRWPGMLGRKLAANVLSESVDVTNKVHRSDYISVPSRGISPKRTAAFDGPGKGFQHRSSNEMPRQLSTCESGRIKQILKFDANSSLLERSPSITRIRVIQSLPKQGSNCPSSPSISASLSTSRSMQSPSRTKPSSPISMPSHAANRACNVSYSLEVQKGSMLTSLSTSRSPTRTRPSIPISLPGHATNRASNTSYIVEAQRGSMSTSLSTSRNIRSPSRTRPSTLISLPGHAANRACNTSYIVEIQRGKKNASQTEAIRQLRLLYNVVLQWHFVNAQTCETSSIQKIGAEKILHATWNNISKFRDSVIMRRTEVQHLRRQINLVMILKEQMAYLNCWAELEKEHDSFLSGFLEALKASTLHIPVSGDSRADVITIRNAISSAVDVMQAMGSSICYLLRKVNSTKLMTSEISMLVAKERAMLAECRELLASVASLQVQESSLRTHLIQLRRDEAITK